MLSVCIITKNEEENIRRCLQSVSGYGFEIIVADTGSADSTMEVVKEYTDKLYEFSWHDDFAAAKNFAVSRASRPYVMVLDSDEYLEPLEAEGLKKLYDMVTRHPVSVGRIRRKNLFTRNGGQQENQEWINRIFPKGKFRYEGRIHEQVVNVDQNPYDTYLTDVVIRHSGYDLTPEERKQKSNRNRILLERELEGLDASERGTEQEAYLLYQLGKSHYMAEAYTEACTYFARGLSIDLNPRLEFVIDMVETYGYALLNSGQKQAALFFENIYEEFKNSADFQFLMGLIYMNNERFQQAAEEFQKAAEHKECRSLGVNSYAAYYNIGVICQCLGKKEEAVHWYQKCGSYEPAQQRITECKR